MGMIIKDGKGRLGSAMRVDEDNRAHVKAVTIPIAMAKSDSSETFILSTYDSTYNTDGWVSLAAADGFSGFLYFTNTSSDKHLHVHHWEVCGFGDGYAQFKAIRNPTGGTLISDAISGNVQNLDIGSTDPFRGACYIPSASGKTVTGGEHLTQRVWKTPGHFRAEYEGSIILNKGDSLALLIKPSVDLSICCEVMVFFETEEEDT